MPAPATKTILLLSGNAAQNHFLKKALPALLSPVRLMVAGTNDAIQDMLSDAGRFGFKPDLIILDLELHTTSGINLPGLVYKAFGGPGSRMLLLTSAADPRGPLYALLYNFRPVQQPSSAAGYLRLLKTALPASVFNPA